MRKVAFCLLVLVSAVVMAEDGARLLVITSDALYNSILPLAQWKHAAGISTRVVKLSQIGSDTASIKSYVRNAYNTWPVRPEYVLLVGSGNAVPARYYSVQHGGSYHSDNIYGDMTGDIRAEVAVGRFPAKSTAQLDLMVAKTLCYERSPGMADSLWMRRLTTVIREGYDSDDTIYWNNVRNAARQAGSAGFVKCDSFSYLRGHNTSHIVNSVNAGTGMVMYRGTAGGNWYEPFNVNPALTANGSMLPIILSFTCETMTLAPYESMVGDAWMKAGSVSAFKGAVAFFGNTHSASNVARQRGAVARGFFDGLFGEKRYRLGQAAMRAKQQLYTEYPTYTADYRGFNLLGDPSLDVWTGTPQMLDVEHPADLRPGTQTLHVVVASNGTPVESALVCASMATDTTVYAYSYTNLDGEVDLEVSPSDTGKLRLVVTGHNLYPYDTLIPVTMVAVEEPSGQPLSSAAGFTVTPSVFGRTARFSWNPNCGARMVSIIDASGRPVARFTTDRSEVNFSTAGLESGTYFCLLTDHTGAVLGRAVAVKLD